MSVLAGLGGGHLHNFAGTTLQHHVAVLTQSRALHGVGGGGARLTSLEIEIGICHGAMGLGRWWRQLHITNPEIKHRNSYLQTSTLSSHRVRFSWRKTWH